MQPHEAVNSGAYLDTIQNMYLNVELLCRTSQQGVKGIENLTMHSTVHYAKQYAFCKLGLSSFGGRNVKSADFLQNINVP